MTNEEAKAFLDNLKILVSEHPVVADWLVEIADRKTEPTISKMEQVDKDINVRSKDEPQTDCDGCQHYAYKHTADACYECSRSYADCYEPQTERSSE